MAQKLIQIVAGGADANKTLKTVNIVKTGFNSPLEPTYTYIAGNAPGIKSVVATVSFVPGLPALIVPNAP
jgi:hypothetical protein